MRAVAPQIVSSPTVEVVSVHGQPPRLPALGPVRPGRQERREGHVEDLLHLVRRRRVRVRVWHGRHPGRQAERRVEDERLGEPPEDVRVRGIEPDLLARLAQRGGEVLLLGIDVAPPES